MDRAVNDEEVRGVLRVSVGGQLSQKENEEWEFKESFTRTTFLDRYPKDLAGFANNKGGTMIFGVKDKPRKPIGLSGWEVKEFQGLDHSQVERILSKLFSGRIRFDSRVVTVDGKNFGVFSIFPAEKKPIIAIKNHISKDTNKEVRTGDIYYRYNAETSRIRPQELENIIQERIEQGQEVLMRVVMSETIKNPPYSD